MERRIGEIFEYEGKILRVKEAEVERCDGCLFSNKCSCDIKWSVGLCHCGMRSDKKDVIFVEAKDIAHETEAVKERKIGETFKYDGKTLEVVETKSETCHQCWFKEDNGRCTRIVSKTGECGMIERSDKKPVIFVEVKNESKEQPQQTDSQQKLNLYELLKDCPKGTKFYSYIFGEDTYFMGVSSHQGDARPIFIYGKYGEGQNFCLTRKGHAYADNYGECCIFPSKEQRDWRKFTAPWLNKESEKFDPKTLKAFDMVIVKPDNGDWHCSILSHREDNNIYYRMVDGYGYSRIIPYNDDTKHLIGTTKEAPDFYKYWED